MLQEATYVADSFSTPRASLSVQQTAGRGQAVQVPCEGASVQDNRRIKFNPYDQQARLKPPLLPKCTTTPWQPMFAAQTVLYMRALQPLMEGFVYWTLRPALMGRMFRN